MVKGNQNSPRRDERSTFWVHFAISAAILLIIGFIGLQIKNRYEQINHLTLANFNSIELSSTEGDSLGDVTALFGRKPANVAETNKKGVSTQLAGWKKVAKEGEYSRVFVYFNQGHAVSKSIKGLKRDETKRITRRDFDALQPGMKKTDVVRLIGTPNAYTYNERFYGISSEQWTYTSQTNLKGKTTVVLTISFKNGRLAAKTQSDLH
ncbi:hypothetical protein LFYK43_08530 [Ligilactobacillus salitolerans]|uniref:DUF3862 domain-containing protein n=1 Tax=Ligilactobacillus salitolerans TaxID=1808352 RepID=A0A401ISA4_9LACO|nr:DUF3862 domain-containing protein [Ligilactobacillus salitolerans]GBG94394.1 hypothetical protein LFYK43_08530 [Ligilactobacillus salitolerans]